MNTTFNKLEIRRIFRDSIKLYFAPLTGACKGIKAELRRVDREIAEGRHKQSKQQGHAPEA